MKEVESTIKENKNNQPNERQPCLEKLKLKPKR